MTNTYGVTPLSAPSSMQSRRPFSEQFDQSSVLTAEVDKNAHCWFLYALIDSWITRNFSCDQHRKLYQHNQSQERWNITEVYTGSESKRQERGTALVVLCPVPLPHWVHPLDQSQIGAAVSASSLSIAITKIEYLLTHTVNSDTKSSFARSPTWKYVITFVINVVWSSLANTYSNWYGGTLYTISLKK